MPDTVPDTVAERGEHLKLCLVPQELAFPDSLISVRILESLGYMVRFVASGWKERDFLPTSTRFHVGRRH